MPFQQSVKRRRPRSETDFLLQAEKSADHTNTDSSMNAGVDTDMNIGISADTSIDTDTHANPSMNAGINTHSNTGIKTDLPTGIHANTDTDTGINAKPWEQYRAKAASKILFNLRLNDRYHTILKVLAERGDEDVTMQGIVKEILLPELERRAAEIE